MVKSGPQTSTQTPSYSSAATDRQAVEEEQLPPTRIIHVTATLQGATPVEATKNKAVDWELLFLFVGRVIFSVRWEEDSSIEFDVPINLLDQANQQVIAEYPLIMLLRVTGGKPGKDTDQLAHPSNRAGGTVDLLPLVMGTNDIRVKVKPVTPLGEEIGCAVHLWATGVGEPFEEQPLIALAVTFVALHCTPAPGKAGANIAYISAVSLDCGTKPAVFGMSLSNADAQRCLWATATTGGEMVRTDYPAPDDDMYIPPDLEIYTEPKICSSAYWNCIKRILIDATLLKERLESPLPIEVAGIPRVGKQDVPLSRFTGTIDASALLRTNQTTLTVCGKLKYYVDEEMVGEGSCGPLLNFAPASAKTSARSKGPNVLICEDSLGHTPFVIIRLDLDEPLTPRPKLSTYFDCLGFAEPEKLVPLNELYVAPPPEDTTIDVKKIRKECGALVVHKELSDLTCKGLMLMNQGIKKTAANKLLTRVRSMLKQFSDGECSYAEWQETVTRQHAAARRAVTASFRPQPPPPRACALPAVPARARMARDQRLADLHLQVNLEAAPEHPRNQMSKVLSLLEARRDSEVTPFILKGIESQTRNRHLLWLYGALKYETDRNNYAIARCAFIIAVKGDSSDGVACTIGRAALHALYHSVGDEHGAFIAAKRMRKAHELKRDWPEFYSRWLDTSGEEETLWAPEVVDTENPFLTASAYFLVLRCYRFSERLLECLERGCATRGSRLGLKTKITEDVFYLRAASLLLRKQPDEALRKVDQAIRIFGPSSILSGLRASCLIVAREWDAVCAAALDEAERWGAKISYTLLLEAARRGMKEDPDGALQRAARVHKARPCAHSALTVARIFGRRSELALAEKWAAAAVKLEPLLADGWAVLALLAMGDRDTNKARTMLRTARQAGPISDDIQAQLYKVIKIVKCEQLADLLVKNLCFCECTEAAEMEAQASVHYLQKQPNTK